MPLTEESSLDSFWKLSDSKEKLRIDAAFKIISNLSRQKNEVNESFQDNFKYALQRFISGLASDRVNSRKGYFVGLVQMLKSFPEEAKVAKVLDVMGKQLNVKGSKSEEADFLCGRMLGYGAILRSELATPDEVGTVFQGLLEISSKRSYLAVACIQFIVDYLPKISPEDFEASVWPQLVDQSPWKGSNAKIEAFWLLLEINKAYPKVPPKSYLQEHFKRKKLLNENLPREIADVLMNGSTNLRIMSQGPVFKGIIDALSDSENLLEDFWLKEIVPRVEKSSSFKTTLAFGLLKLIVSAWKGKDNLSSLLPRGLAEVSLQLLSKLESSSEDDLMITSALDGLVEEAKGTKGQQELIKTFLSVNVCFDKMSGTNLVQKLLANASLETVKQAAEFFKVAVASAQNSSYTIQQRVYSGQQLAKLVGHPSASEDPEWKVEIISYLLTLTQFEITKVQWPLKTLPSPLPREAKHELKEIFFKALDLKLKNLENACKILVKVVNHAETLMKSQTPFHQLNQSASQAWKDMLKSVKKITEKGEDKIKKEDRVFLMLLIHIGFQLFSNDANTAIELLGDLHVCYEKAKSSGKKQKKSKNSDDQEPQWIEVVTDLMLSLLSQNRNVLRQVVNSVTAMLCPFMTQNSLMAIMDVINPPEEDKDEDMEEDDDEFEPITEEDLEKLKAQQEEEESEDEDEEEESDEEDSDQEENNENTEPSDELRNKLKAAMDGDDSDAESINIDDLDDEAIEKLDTALGQVFRQLSGKKSTAEKKKEKKNALAQVHFKIRALDMIDSYISHQPPVGNVFFLSIPLIKALEASSKDKLQAPLETRIKGTLKKLTNIKKPEVDPKVTGDNLVELLNELILMGSTGLPVVTQMNQPIPLFAQLANLIVKYSMQIKEDRIQEVFAKALNEFFDNPQCILPISFFQLPLQGNWPGSLSLIKSLTKGAFSGETRPFRRIQAVTLLSTIYHNGNIRGQIDDKMTKELSEKVMESLQSFVQGDNNLKHKMLCEILHLIYGLHLSGSKSVPWTEMKEILEKVRAKVPKNRNFHEVKRAFNKISAPLKIKVVQGNEKKEKAADNEPMELNGETNGEVNHEQKKKKKKKASKEVLQKKKERKRFELEEQYKNVELPSFKGALMDTINDDDDGEVVDAPKTKKKKMK